MNHLSPWQIAVIALFGIIPIMPAARILQRMGYSGWWAVLTPISPLNIIGLWILAYSAWPANGLKSK